MRFSRWQGKDGEIMELGVIGWTAAVVAVLLTGISKSALGGAMSGLSVPILSIWLAPTDAVGVMLPILIAIDLFGIRAWRGRASGEDLRVLIPASLLGIVLGSLLFGVLTDRWIKLAIGILAVGFMAERLFKRYGSGPIAATATAPGRLAWLCGCGAGLTSTLAHAGGPPVMYYLLRRGLDKTAFVATSVMLFAVVNAAKLPFYLGMDLITAQTLWMSALLFPLVPLGVMLGVRVLRYLPDRVFFGVAITTLGLSGVKLIFDALVGQ